MTKVIIGEDCGNSPKNIFLEKLAVAFAKGDAKFILGKVTDDVRWNIVGDKLIQGKESLGAALKEAKDKKAVELAIHHVATHGKTGAVDGRRKLENGRILAFCDVYELSNAKGTEVKEIISYVIELR